MCKDVYDMYVQAGICYSAEKCLAITCVVGGVCHHFCIYNTNIGKDANAETNADKGTDTDGCKHRFRTDADANANTQVDNHVNIQGYR